MSLKKLLFFIVVILTIGGFYLWPEPAPHYPTAGSSIVIFGDSLAAGVGASATGDLASQLATALGTEVVNLGVAGDTTSDGLARIDKVVAVDPRVVIIILGGNDALQQVPVAETFTNLSHIIETIQATGAAVILVGEPGGLYGDRYAKEYKQLAENYRTFYVTNILSGLIGRTEYMSDYVHPNDAGYALAAERITPVVIEALSNH